MRFLCRVVGHALPPGLSRHLSIYFTCARCGDCVRGGFLGVYVAKKGKS